MLFPLCLLSYTFPIRYITNFFFFFYILQDYQHISGICIY